MTGLDWAIVAVLLLSVLTAAAQGLVFEIFSLAGGVFGYLLAAWEYPRLAPWFLPYAKAQWVADAAAFLVVFFAVLLLAGVAGSLARWAMKEVGLRWADRLLGGVFGLLRGVLMVSAVVLALAAFPPGPKLLAESRLGGYFLVSARVLTWAAPAEVRQRFRQGVMALRKARAGDTPAPGGPSQGTQSGPRP